MRIAHLSAEVTPFAKTGGLGDVAGALPIFQAALGHEVAVWMPYYRQVREWLERHDEPPRSLGDPLAIDLGFRTYIVALLATHLPDSRVPVYLVAHDPFFDRPSIYGASNGEDDGYLRYPLFVRAVLEAMRRFELVPDVLHAHDWHASLAPMALAWDEPRDWHFEKTATVLTVHNAAFQGIYPTEAFVHLGLPPQALSGNGVGWEGKLNLLKGGVVAADAVTAVSPTFAREITTKEGGFGLDQILRGRGADLTGIVNGIDPGVWNPAVDRRLPARYDASHLEGKRENRRHLLIRAGMDPDDRDLVVGSVGRLTWQKGYDLAFSVIDQLVADGIRFVFLGSGEPALEAAIFAAAHRAPGRVWGDVGLQEDLAHLIESGADAFLMPSRFEPCGLNQMYSLAYGTPPIVRRVGGLADTVVPYDGKNAEVATGFAFDAPDATALKNTVLWAHQCQRHPVLWNKLMQNGMAQDFSWTRSAEKYLDVYRRAIAHKSTAG